MLEPPNGYPFTSRGTITPSTSTWRGSAAEEMEEEKEVLLEPLNDHLQCVQNAINLHVEGKLSINLHVEGKLSINLHVEGKHSINLHVERGLQRKWKRRKWPLRMER